MLEDQRNTNDCKFAQMYIFVNPTNLNPFNAFQKLFPVENST